MNYREFKGRSTIKIYNGDCMEYMRDMKDNEYSLAIVDPPYGLGIDGQKESICKNPKHNRKKHEHKGWDIKIPQQEYFKDLFRINKNQIIWGANYFVEHIYKSSKGWIVWYKGQQGLTMSDAELAFCSVDTPTRVVTINRAELNKDGTIHPTQKPIKLYKWLLQNYAKENDTILDTHLGSGSIAIACWDLGFDLTAFEIDKEYFTAARDRIELHTRQEQMYPPEEIKPPQQKELFKIVDN